MDFKVGDRVRVTFEGVVSSDQFDDEIQIRTEGGHHWAPVSAVEKIAPRLPTTPGSVIRFVGIKQNVYIRTHTGWCYLTVKSGKTGTSYIEDDTDPALYEVIFDAGQLSPAKASGAK